MRGVSVGLLGLGTVGSGVVKVLQTHRAELEETLKRIAASSLRPGDSVLLQHREGSPWDYLYITHYTGWKDLAAQQEDPEAGARARRAGLTQDAGLELRQHMASHHDTIAERVAIQAAK